MIEYIPKVFLTVLTDWIFAPVVKEKSLLLLQWLKSKWDPFSYDFPS